MVDFFSKVNNFFYGNLSKNKQIKIVVIGNCQSRPIARCLSLLN
ncbi:MAG: Polysaccharide biosynthesis enzyme WcbI, partial [Campylobacterota bacterium]|nr:Polysaccharide biosynthesis enzyme WcbI [Campylobacterota bacterium]